MPVIVFDDFTRPDDPSSLGTATTGQVWVPYDENWTPGDTRWGILSNQAAREAGGNPSVGNGGYALVESGISNCVIEVTINNAAFGGDLNNNNFGIIFRWEDENHYYQAVWSRAGRFLRICHVVNGFFSCTNEGFPGPAQIQDGDTLSVILCDSLIQGAHNGIVTVTADGTGGSMGTMHGLQCGNGIISETAFSLYDDFTVETNSNCEGANWVLPMLSWSAEGVVESDTPTGGVRTLRFDAGSGSQYYYVAPVTDSSNELTTKTVKSVRATGRLTNASAKLYRYDVAEGINLDDLEDGTNSTTGAIPIPDSTLVAQSAQLNTNVTNCALSTVRIEGDDRGQDIRNELHEVVLQVADAGVRR